MRLEEGIEQTKASLDLTPLIDVVFLLVLFFAVTTSFISPEDLAALERSVEVLTIEVEERDVRIEGLDEQVSGLRGTLAERDDELRTREARISDLLDRIEAIEAALAERDRTIEDQAGRIGTQADRISELEGELTLSLDQLETLGAEADGLRSSLASLELESEGLKGSLEAFADERAALTADLTALRRRIGRSEARFAVADDEREDLKVALAAAEALNETLTRELAAARAAAEAAGVESAAAISSLDDDVAELQLAVAALETERDQLKASLGRSELELNVLADMVRDLTDERDRLLQAMAEAEAAALARVEAIEEESAEARAFFAANEEQIRRAVAAEENLSQSLSTLVSGGALDVARNGNRLTINLSNRILFPSGSAELRAEGLEVLGRVADVLSDRLAGLNVQIGGHTDNIPVSAGGAFDDNWDLSAARALSVVRYFEANGVEARRLSAVGYGDEQPVATNDTAEGRALNRRIEMVLVQP